MQTIFARDIPASAERRSTKVILEEIDDTELECGKLLMEAKGIVEEVKATSRAGESCDLTQKARFDRLTDEPNGILWQTKARLNNLRAELAQRQEQERQLIMSRNPNAIMASDIQSGWRPERVLPTDGRLPGDGASRYAPFGRMAKLKAFRDEQSAYDSGMWYKAILARAIRGTIDTRAESHCEKIGLEISNTAYEGSGTAGGYTLPSPVSSAIIEVRERVGIARQVCNVMPTSGDVLSVPKKTGGLTVYVTAETSEITASDKSWGSVGLTIKARKCLSLLSQELSEDSLINMVDNIVSEQGYALALKEDSELINGTGISTDGGIQGLLSKIGAAGVSTAAVSSTWAALTIGEVTAAVGLLPDRFFPYEPSWICSHSFFNQVFMRLAIAAGGVTLAEVMSGTPNVRSFLGYRVYLTSQMPVATAVSQKSALFGAFNQAVILADRGGLRVQRSDDVKFIEDLIALKTVSRYDMNVHDAGDASNPGAYVALATHA